MLPDQAPGIPAGAARLAAEAGAVGAVFDRQAIPVQDLVPVQVGDGHLGGGDQEIVRARHLEGVLLKLGQLARAGHGGPVHHIGREDLRIAVLGVGVQVIADDGPLQPAAQAPVHGEPGAGDFAGPGEIEDVQALADVPMGLGLEGKGRGLSPAAQLLVGGIVRAFGHGFVGDVGHPHKHGVQGVVHFPQGAVQGLDLVRHFLHFRHDGRSVLPGLFHLGDLGGNLVPLGLQGFHLLHQLPALFVQGQ